MEQLKVRKRYDYLDIAKAITIFLVIIGHAAPNTDDPFFRVVIYSFHMPLFFMISGVFVRRHQTSGYGIAHWKDFFCKLYASVVLDCFNGEILALAMDDNMKNELCIATVKQMKELYGKKWSRGDAV